MGAVVSAAAPQSKHDRASDPTDAGKAKPAAERRVQSAAAPSPFPPIADYAFLSDCHTGALLAPDGSIDWLCVPRFDAPSVFGSLLDREAGLFRLGPFGVTVPSDRHYVPGTNVLVTTWKTSGGWVEVHDALTMGPTTCEDRTTPHTRPPADEDADHMLVRTVKCLEGEVEIELICEPAFDYGRAPAAWTLVDGSRHTADATGSGQTIRLQTNLELGIEANRVRAGHTLAPGEQAYVVLAWGEELAVAGDIDDANQRLDATVRFWRRWLARARPFPDHRWREAIQRSALTIKGLTYMPTGATVAALTTSLPETPGGERNWDYRYTWMRDSTFTLQALHLLGLDWEADEFMQFVADVEPNSDGGLQIMYGIDGRRDLTETLREDLSGYSGARPVRIGNGAFDQRQNDVFGAVLDSILKHTMHSQRLPRRLWPIVQAQAGCATSVWGESDQGIWEARGKPQHYVSSKLMCWVAMDRAAKLAAIRDDPALQAKWPPPRRSTRTSSPTVSSTGCCASTTTPTPWMPRRCWRRSSVSCPAMTNACTRVVDWCGRSRERFEGIVGWLGDPDAAALEHGELEAQLQVVGRELLRALFGDHLALRAEREPRLDPIADERGVKRRTVERDHERPLASVFGEVTVSRLAYRARGEENLYVADGLWNLPEQGAADKAAIQLVRVQSC